MLHMTYNGLANKFQASFFKDMSPSFFKDMSELGHRKK